MREGTWLNLPSLSLPIKSLFTGYLLVAGLGLLMAGAQIMLTHGMADGKFGLSVDDIVYSYYGNREGSKLEAKLNGSMKDKATPQENFTLIKWARNGASEEEWKTTIKPIVEAKCAMCHANIPSLPNITKYEVMKERAKVDEGASVSSLTRVSHIHLFGISFIFFFIGLIFSMAIGFKYWVKALLIFTPFAFLIVDIASWWLTKINPNFAYFVIIGGFGYSLASTVMILTSLWQMWITPIRGGHSEENTWRDG
ncbi:MULTISPECIES: elongation factor-1 alpha [Thiomicrorhabdus]|uniref:Elongation factor-1 alpha n=1 Tax=Thiomicrorhabdus heinhorstiae TaxID=2748010 RepID=A0ABS0BSC5_9GAMM|nr:MULTISPECIES: elongation factor-1 alpha [Thiomicrorhabdus]MBF6056771.1 elongation factor-1 alpha [Thiomicrorhabdus heinhorstiae]